MARTAYFVIADISGYTSFLTRSELDHAQGILEGLLQTLVDHMKPPLVISNFQGDAILAYAPDSAVVQGQAILEAVENLYCAFAAAQEQMERNTTCPCQACQNIPELDLKFIVHRGEYAVQTIGGRQELGGPDVIVAHRLLKNDIASRTGIMAYALVTEAAARAMDIADFFASLPTHTEQYEHVGAVSARVHALHPVWQARRSRQRIFAGPGDRLFVDPTNVDLPVSPSRAWAYVSEPAYKVRWLEGVTGMTVSGLDRGRTGVGTTQHCAHGKQVLPLKIVDWRPFEHLTHEFPLPVGATNMMTFALTPIEGGIRVGLY
ncbi:MAG: DUF2652 domain-containing protein, partial [Dongiaceae bacterium]